MMSNGRAQGGNNELASNISPQEQQYADLLEFKQESQNGVKNVFIYAPERVNVLKLLAGSPGILGAYFGSSPDQFTYHNLTSAVKRRIGDNPTVTLDVNYTVLANYSTFSDTSTSDFSCNLYMSIGTIFDQSYLTSGSFPLFSVRFYPFLVINAGTFTWTKSTATYTFFNYNTNLILNNTLQSRGSSVVGGTSYQDFTTNPTQMTEEQFQRYIIQGGVPIAISYAFDSSALAAGNASFMAANFFANVSYAFNYYGLLSNF